MGVGIQASLIYLGCGLWLLCKLGLWLTDAPAIAWLDFVAGIGAFSIAAGIFPVRAASYVLAAVVGILGIVAVAAGAPAWFSVLNLVLLVPFAALGRTITPREAVPQPAELPHREAA